MWSKTGTPITSPASTNCRVIRMSAKLGSGLPLGCWWATMMPAAFARIAALNTCLGSTMEAARPPDAGHVHAYGRVAGVEQDDDELLPVLVLEVVLQEDGHGLGGVDLPAFGEREAALLHQLGRVERDQAEEVPLVVGLLLGLG